MRGTGRYDGALQMFVEEAREPDLRRLEFQRWLAERGRLEHGVAGPPAGRHAMALGKRVVAVQRPERVSTLATARRWSVASRSRGQAGEPQA